jgi:hypothetical protein
LVTWVRFVKKITKPIAKVLDKVVPNEIKPALPYLAAFAPFMLSPGFGATMFSSMSPTVSSMIARGLVGGGANALSQLAQEGNEGDLSLGRVALAAAPAALSAPGAGDYFQWITNSWKLVWQQEHQDYKLLWGGLLSYL